jgi:hypothetical protein
MNNTTWYFNCKWEGDYAKGIYRFCISEDIDSYIKNYDYKRFRKDGHLERVLDVEIFFSVLANFANPLFARYLFEIVTKRNNSYDIKSMVNLDSLFLSCHLKYGDEYFYSFLEKELSERLSDYSDIIRFFSSEELLFPVIRKIHELKTYVRHEAEKQYAYGEANFEPHPNYVIPVRRVDRRAA